MREPLGVPTEDYDTFRVRTTDVGLVFSMVHGADIVTRAEKAVVGVDSPIEDKAKTPGDDLISALVATQRAEGQVTEDKLRGLLVTLVFVAHDTTRRQLSNAMVTVTFAEHPEQWNLLAQRPELAPQAVEEIMRWFPSTTIAYRCATEDFDYRARTSRRAR